jgi:hypothetical protein
MDRSFGLLIISIGAVIVLLGLIVYSGGLSWFGKLPGDLRFGSDRMRVYIPLTSMLLISIALSAIMYLIGRFFR